MISHVDASSDLLWQLTKKHNAFLRTSAHGHGETRFSTESGNVKNVHSYKHSGLANANSIDIVELESKKPAATVNGKACKGIFQAQAAAVKALAEETRPDLTADALARISAVHKAGRVKAATSA